MAVVLPKGCAVIHALEKRQRPAMPQRHVLEELVVADAVLDVAPRDGRSRRRRWCACRGRRTACGCACPSPSRATRLDGLEVRCRRTRTRCSWQSSCARRLYGWPFCCTHCCACRALLRELVSSCELLNAPPKRRYMVLGDRIRPGGPEAEGLRGEVRRGGDELRHVAVGERVRALQVVDSGVRVGVLDAVDLAEGAAVQLDGDALAGAEEVGIRVAAVQLELVGLGVADAAAELRRSGPPRS